MKIDVFIKILNWFGGIDVKVFVDNFGVIAIGEGSIFFWK